MSRRPSICLCIALSASLTNLRSTLPRAAAEITYDTKLTLHKAAIKQFFKLLKKYTFDANDTEHFGDTASM